MRAEEERMGAEEATRKAQEMKRDEEGKIRALEKERMRAVILEAPLNLSLVVLVRTIAEGPRNRPSIRVWEHQNCREEKIAVCVSLLLIEGCGVIA